jgi:hypothetical protein
MIFFNQLLTGVSRFINAHTVSNGGPGQYRYSCTVTQPTLYSSCYASMASSLLGSLDRLETVERGMWATYLNKHQDADGLYRDPVIFDQGWYAGDPLWCGRPHLTCHVITALACLGYTAARPIEWLNPWRNPDRLVKWLKERNWDQQISWSGNEILNVGTLLQYTRDFQNDNLAGHAVDVLLDWLATHHLQAETGMWGSMDLIDPFWRSHAVQAAYHWWLLFFYDRVPIPNIERAIDTVLAAQNPAGGFGWGVHNPENPYHSSACEDIDSIDPLCRMMQQTNYRRDDIQFALARAADWVLTNQMADGGFVFILDRPFEYGHAELSGEKDAGAMFPTWFRLLSLAFIARALPDHPLAQIPWRFTCCPGMQFWEVE